MSKQLGIITVLYNQKDHLRALLESLSNQTYKDFRIYLIDNNSTDGSYQAWNEFNKEFDPDINYIYQHQNLGYAAGTNIGAKLAIKDGCKYLFILNTDIVLHEKCLTELSSLIESDGQIACVGPLILRHQADSDDIIQEYGGAVSFKKGTVEKFFSGQNPNKVNLPEIKETDFISGGACFIRSELFERAGMLEESYFAYFDEIDLFYRLRNLGNFKMYVTSKAIVWHSHDWSPRNPISYYIEYYLGQRNKYLFFYKSGFYFSIFLSCILDIVKFPIRLIWFKKVCDFKLGFYYLKGWIDGILGIKGKPKFIY